MKRTPRTEHNLKVIRSFRAKTELQRIGIKFTKDSIVCRTCNSHIPVQVNEEVVSVFGNAYKCKLKRNFTNKTSCNYFSKRES